MHSVNEDALDQRQQELCDAVADLVPKVPLHISSTLVQEQTAHWAKQVVIYLYFQVTLYCVPHSNFYFRWMTWGPRLRMGLWTWRATWFI